MSRGDLAPLAVLLAAGFAIRLYFLQFYEVISADGISYVAIARDFISGKGLAAATHSPPFFPILLGLASTLTHDFEHAGLAVSVFMGSFVVVPVYLLGAEFYDRRVGAAAAFLATTWPTLRFWSTAVMSQATYITLLLLGIYFLWRAYRNSAALPAVLAGAFFGCAHLTRSEGVIVFLAQLAVLVTVTLGKRLEPRRLLCLLVSLAVFAAVFSPYCVMLHHLTGKWQLTGKSRITIADALSEYLRKPDLKHDPSFKEVSYLDLFRRYPDYIRSNYLKNIAACWRQMLPWYGWLLAGVGLLVGMWNKRGLTEGAFLLASFAPLAVIIVFFFIGPEYTQPYLPVLLLFICKALVAGADTLAHGGGGSLAQAEGLIASLPLFIAVSYGSWNVIREMPVDREKPYSYARDEGRLDDKHIGIKLAQTLPERAVLMTRSGRIGFYSNRSYVTPPQTDYAGIVAFARKYRVDYLIANPLLMGMRPQLKFLYAPILEPDRPFSPPPELELVKIDREPGGQSYIIYRFKPIGH